MLEVPMMRLPKVRRRVMARQQRSQVPRRVDVPDSLWLPSSTTAGRSVFTGRLA